MVRIIQGQKVKIVTYEQSANQEKILHQWFTNYLCVLEIWLEIQDIFTQQLCNGFFSLFQFM